MSAVRRDVLNGTSPQDRERLAAAEKTRSVYRAWNAVVGSTREGAHVTGLRYLPEKNRLLVYLESSVWTQELTMAREVIRARMEREGVALDGFIFKTSKAGYAPAGIKRGYRKPRPKPPVPHEDLSAEEEDALDGQVSTIKDKRLAAALRKAMKASLEWKKGCDARNGA